MRSYARPDYIAILIIILVFLSISRNVETRFLFDVHTDEAASVYAGYSLGKNVPLNPEYCPIYVCWYYLLSMIAPDIVKLYYINKQLLSLFLPIMLYVLLRVRSLPVIYSLFIAVWILTINGNLPLDIKVYHFAVIAVLISLMISSIFNASALSIGIAATGGLIASYIRPEFFLSYALLFFMLLFHVWKNRFKPGRIKYMVLAVVIIISLLFFMWLRSFPVRVNGSKPLLAFSQSFSLNWTTWTQSKLSPWTDYDEIMRAHFGGPSTIWEALRNNPKMFIRHILSNMANSPGKAVSLFLNMDETLTKSLSMKRVYTAISSIAVLSMVILFLFKLRKIKSTLKRDGHFILLVVCFIVPPAIAITLFYPRDHYLVSLGTLCIVFVSTMFASPKEFCEEAANGEPLRRQDVPDSGKADANPCR